MIGVDTNILLRAVLDDDVHQSPVAQAFLAARSAEDPAVINAVVLVEFVWTLKRKYRARPDVIIGLLDDLAASPAIMLLDREVILAALQDYRDDIGAFTDVLIARLNVAAGCVTTATFDKGAPEITGFTLLA
jgi:predicted nucleic-acid-binding protein